MKIAIIGYYYDAMGQESSNCFSVMSMLLTKALRARNHTVYPYHILNGGVGSESVDIVITILFDSDNINGGQFWKNKLNAKRSVSFLETPNGGCDFSFIFNPDFSKYLKSPHLLLKFPIPDKYVYSKEPKSIFLDHCWPEYKMKSHQKDISENISNWFLGSEYKIYKHVRFEEDFKMIKPSETPIPVQPYFDYINTIKSIDCLVVTHTESFAYGVLDFVSVNSKIVAPENFLPNFLISNFNIRTFTNKTTLLKQLSEYTKVSYDMSKFHTYDQIAEIMEGYFKSWI